MVKKKEEEEIEEIEVEAEESKTPLYIEIYSTYQGIPAGLYEWSEAESTYPALIRLYRMYKEDGALSKRPDGEGNATIRVYTEEVKK